VSPRLVKTLGRWGLYRWDYPDAPLTAERECKTIEASIDLDGALEIRFTELRGEVFVPANVLAELLTDYEQHKAAR
jgi:hypothetical protein